MYTFYTLSLQTELHGVGAACKKKGTMSFFTSFKFLDLIVETIVASLPIAMAFWYDEWRTEDGDKMPWSERFGVQVGFTMLSFFLVYAILHRRLRLLGREYTAPMIDDDREIRGIVDDVLRTHNLIPASASKE